jgi:hypothetical protein
MPSFTRGIHVLFAYWLTPSRVHVFPLHSNPTMLDHMAVQSGLSKETLQKMFGMLSEMSDEQLEVSLKSMAKVQKYTSAVQNAWKSANQLVGGKLKHILITVGVLMGVFLVLYLLGGSQNDSTSTTVTAVMEEAMSATVSLKSSTPHQAVVESIEDEFSEL